MTATLRLPYASLSPQAFEAMLSLKRAYTHGPLPVTLIDLVLLRVSQINGCAYCVDLHWRDLVQHDVDVRKLNALAAWHEMPFFSEQERAALHWAELVTRTSGRDCTDDEFQRLRGHFTEAEVAHLGFAIAGMNAWNRLAVPFRQDVTV